MRGGIVLAAVLLLLFLLGQLRLGAVGEYGPGGAGAWFRAGPVRIRLYPRRRSGPSKKEKAPKPGKEHPAGEANSKMPALQQQQHWHRIPAWRRRAVSAAGCGWISWS